MTGVAGSDNAHFRDPNDVVVDGRGYIYVSENGNYRVQVFDANRNYVRTIGVTGEGGDGFDHLNGPYHLAVDAYNNLYVSSPWNHAVHVYDQDGAYLTTIGESRGNRTGQLADPHGLAFDAAGNLYIVDYNNHRIQKFAPGVPGWRQVNINGFGDRRSQIIASLTPFGEQLYAGVENYSGSGAQLWRWRAGEGWTAMTTNGFGDTSNTAVNQLAEFKGDLYASTWNQNMSTGQSFGGQLWRSPTVRTGARWSLTDSATRPTARYTDWLSLAIPCTRPPGAIRRRHGAEIWRSSTGNNGDWARVVSNGFGDAEQSISAQFSGYRRPAVHGHG